MNPLDLVMYTLGLCVGLLIVWILWVAITIQTERDYKTFLRENKLTQEYTDWKEHRKEQRHKYR